MNEPKDLIRWTLTFLNWSIYKWDIMPIDGEFKWIIELRDGSYYPVIFIFSKWECTDFNLIDDHDLSTMLIRWYNPVFWIKSDRKPFNKEEISELFNFDEYKKDWSKDIHIMIQHLIWNYDWDNIWYMPEWSWELTYKNGDAYVWGFRKWIPEWKWKLTFYKYWKMEWEFKDWMPNWEWKSLYPNWWEYEWEFKNWKPDWKWKVIYTNGEMYEWKRENWKFIW